MKTLNTLAVCAMLAPACSIAGQLPVQRALTNGRSAVVFLFTAGCPHNPQGVKDANALTGMLQRQYAVYGITNLGDKDASRYLKKLGAKFHVLGDARGKAIAKLGGRHSLDLLVLGSDGKTKHFWGGYNREVMKQVAAILPRKGTNDPAVKLDLTKFPTDLQSGCAFPSP